MHIVWRLWFVVDETSIALMSELTERVWLSVRQFIWVGLGSKSASAGAFVVITTHAA